jgi:type I restriction enzyme, R subunit
MDNISFKKDHISQIPAIELLQKLGYNYITPDEALEMRGGKTSNVLLEDILRNQPHELNSIRINNSKEARFSEQNIENGVLAMRKLHKLWRMELLYLYFMKVEWYLNL